MHYSITFIILTWICSYKYYTPAFGLPFDGLPIDEGIPLEEADLLPISENVSVNTTDTGQNKPARRVNTIVDDYLYHQNFRWYNPGTWRFLDWVYCILIILLIVAIIVGAVILYRKLTE